MKPYPVVTGVISLGVEQPEHEADHSSPSRADSKNAWSYTSAPPYIFIAWCLIKNRLSSWHNI